MKKITIKLVRYDSQGMIHETFQILVQEKSTVLEVLLQIYDTQDSTLAFSHGCRVKNCGLCVVNVNGRPRYACVTKITPNAEISPLHHLPLIRDLVFDREYFFQHLERFTPYIVRERYSETEPEILVQPYEHTLLMSCRECFACLSSCHKYDYRNESFGGPLGFVKLAQLRHDKRDSLDRVSQARQMGIENCAGCTSLCTCILGIPLRKIVIKPLLEATAGKK